MNPNPLDKVINYYRIPESRWGYNLVLGGIKHFGFYPDNQEDIDEVRAQQIMQDLLAERLQLTQDTRVLDAGCGQGRVSLYLAAKYGCQIQGIDIVPFEVKKAQRLARQKGLADRVKFARMDYTDLQFPDGSFDALFSMETLVHAYDIEKVLAGFHRVLKPGGRFAHFEYSLAPDEVLADYLDRYDEKRRREIEHWHHWCIEKSGMHSFMRFRHGNFRQLLQKTGFEEVAEENITSNVIPSILNLTELARTPYKIIKFLHLQNFFVNTTVAAEWFPFVTEGDIFRYNIFTGRKPA